MRQNAWVSCIKAVPSLLLAITLSGCGGGGGDSATSSGPSAPGPAPASIVDVVSTTQPNPLIVQHSFIAAGKGFSLSPNSTFPGTFRAYIITNGRSNPRSITFVTSNTPGSRVCTTSITLPDGRMIELTPEQIDRVYWPNRTSPEYLVLSTCGSAGGSAVMLFPAVFAKGNLSKSQCESQPDGFYSAAGEIQGCIFRFPSSADSVNQSNPSTKGYYLFNATNLENAETLMAPYLIVNERPHSYPDDSSLRHGKLNIAIRFCGVPKLNVIPPGSVNTNAFLFTQYVRQNWSGPIGGTLNNVQEIGWPSQTGASVSYVGCSGADDVTYGNLDSLAEFEELNSKYGSSTPGTIIVWVVNNLNFRTDGSIGVSPSPGVPYIYGTSSSAIAIESPADDLSLATPADWNQMAVAMAHEVGHFLGLRHTTEIGGSPDGISQVDFLPFTPYCSKAVWTLPFGANCPDRENLMFPFVPSGKDFHVNSNDQQSFVNWNPLVY